MGNLYLSWQGSAVLAVGTGCEFLPLCLGDGSIQTYTLVLNVECIYVNINCSSKCFFVNLRRKHSFFRVYYGPKNEGVLSLRNVSDFYRI